MSLWAITGGNGFVGRHLVRQLVERGTDVRALDLEQLVHPGVDAIAGDVRDPRAVARLCRGADVVVHAAAALPIRRSAPEIRSVTVGGTAAALAAAAEAGVRRFVFLSSGVVYDFTSTGPVTEDGRAAPFEPYGLAKLEAEQHCLSFGARGIHVVVLRPSAVVGPERLGIFGILFDWIRAGRRIYTIGPGRNRYQLLDVSDLADAIVLAGERQVRAPILNIGAAEVAPVRAELEGLVAHAGTSSRVTALPAGPARMVLAALAATRLSPLSGWHYRTADRDVVLDVALAGQELGWFPRYSSGEALARAYDALVAGCPPERSTGMTHRTHWNERALGLLRRVS